MKSTPDPRGVLLQPGGRDLRGGVLPGRILPGVPVLRTRVLVALLASLDPPAATGIGVRLH
jgi:hypothetical protein